VTGATGFVGGHLTQRLVRDGRRVRCLVRETSDTSPLARLDVELVYGDLRSPDSLARAVAGCRYVVHCGALVSDWATVEEIREINVVGTRSLLDVSVAAGVKRVVHLSTTDVYGYPGVSEVDETHPHGRFRNWYAQTKLEAEREARCVEEATGLELVILRPATVYGPGSEEVVREMATAIRGGHMILVGGGHAMAGLIYVENLADAAVLSLVHDAAPGQAFNLTDGVPVTWRQFLDGIADGLGYRRVRFSLPYGVAFALGLSLEQAYRLLRRTTGLTVAPLLSRQAVHVLGRPQDFSSRKARAVLGWAPRVDYAAGLAATVAWLAEEFAGQPPSRGRARSASLSGTTP
jgi:nucleoside-diphosphate-sugar epimerase